MVLVVGHYHDALSGVSNGVSAYSRQYTSWRLELGGSLTLEALHWRLGRGCCGIISVMGAADELKPLLRPGFPVVNTLGNLKDPTVASVDPDDHAVGRLAVDWLANHGYRRVAFYGMAGPWAQDRAAGAAAAALQRKLVFSTNASPRDPDRWTEWSKVTDPAFARRFLKKLAKPTAVVACSDAIASLIADQCAELHLRIPQDISIIGVDNAISYCDSGRVTLSSIDVDLERIGFEAGRLLHQIIQHKDVPLKVTVPPRGVVQRHSTDPAAHEDPLVAKAMLYIQSTALEGGTVEKLCAHLDLSRRNVEKRFLAATGRGPLEEFLSVRMHRACELLVSTNLPITSIALRCGYGQTSSFSAAFRREKGMPPREYRRRQSYVGSV